MEASIRVFAPQRYTRKSARPVANRKHRCYSHDSRGVAFSPQQTLEHSAMRLPQQSLTLTGPVIMTLGDLNLINYTLQWYDEIGNADPVRNFWVYYIGPDGTSPPCGWVYESGDLSFSRGTNHIHLPTDSRVMNSPEYVLWFWICV